jgi:hypothetical protein
MPIFTLFNTFVINDVAVGRIFYLDEFRQGGPRERQGAKARGGFAKARQGMLEFKPLRDRLRDEAKALSYFFRGRGLKERPDDFELRLARVCLAMYLIETIDRMAPMADRKQNLQNSFESARKALRELLDDSYFSASSEQIMGEYSKREPAFRHCASRCGISLLEPEPAVEATKMRLAGMIDDINSL